MEKKTIFISYSWENPDVVTFVENLTKKLKNPLLNIIIDRQNLKPGNDMIFFMENSLSIPDKVLIICDKSYMSKANSRVRGVGIETKIITPEIYNNTEQDKFIPILLEGEECVPTYLKNIYGVQINDFSLDDKTIESIQKIIFDYNDFELKDNNIPSFLIDSLKNEENNLEKNEKGFKSFSIKDLDSSKDKVLLVTLENKGQFDCDLKTIEVRLVASRQYNSYGNHIFHLFCNIPNREPFCFAKIEGNYIELAVDEFTKEGKKEIILQLSVGAHTKYINIYQFNRDLSLSMIEGSNIGSDTPFIEWGTEDNSFPKDIYAYNRNWGSNRDEWQHSRDVYKYNKDSKKYSLHSEVKLVWNEDDFIEYT